ncbi:MAG: hypothetical protein FWG87_01685 [Defluviitaleaceae bacterium]|nr:hypothetical protein [Defluviitaleaceae bacterium]
MKYFKNISSFHDLRTQYRKLALENHPDVGGDVKTMQEINNEYDQLFAIWKRRSNITSNETAHSTRREFYTQNGWEGKNYNKGLSLKEIACIIREFIKIHYSDFKFSVTTDYGSMSQALRITLMEGPRAAFKTYSELTEEERSEVRQTHTRQNNIESYYPAEIDKEIAEVFDRRYAEKYLTDYIKEAVGAVEDYANSFNQSDCDSMIDYFSVNFWFHGVKIGKLDKPYKIVARAKKEIPDVEYEDVEITKTRRLKAIEPQEIAAPEQFERGQLFQLKNSFNYGCCKGLVYQIDRICHNYIYAYKLGKSYKNVCKGNIRGNSFNTEIEKLSAWVERGAIVFVELVEVTKTEEYTSIVRRPKKQTAISTDIVEFADKGHTITQDGGVEFVDREYTVTPDVDTRDNSPLWVVKFGRMERSDFLTVREQIKEMGGYYSRFKRGFIFQFEPTEKLKDFNTAM